MNLESFAAERRERLTVADDVLRPRVGQALTAYAAGEEGWADAVVAIAGQLWLENFEAEAPGAGYMAALRRFRVKLAEVMALTGQPEGEAPDAQVERITRWVSTYAVNSGTVQGAYARGVRYKMWVDMDDEAVRAEHAAVDGQVIPIGGAFTVAGIKMGHPGEPVGPPSVWINCRCVAMPAARTGETMSLNTFDLGDSRPVENPVEEAPRQGALVVLIPAADDPVVAASSEDAAHMTTVWFGDSAELEARDTPEFPQIDLDTLIQEVRNYASDLDGPIVVPVKERGKLGDDDADVVFLEPTGSLIALRDGMLQEEQIGSAHNAVEQYPEWTPHVTLGYPEGVEGGPAAGEYDGDEVTFDRVGLWIAGEKYEYPMGGTVSTVTADAAAVIGDVDETENLEPGIPAEDYVADDEPEDGEELITEIPVHGVLAPEGVETGDRRGFRPGALSVRTLPVPLRLEIVGTHGGTTSEVVTVGRVDKAWRDEASGMWRFQGAVILSKEHAQKAIEGMIDGSGRGVSIDADDIEMDMASFSEEALAEAQAAGRRPTEWFSKTRVAGLTIVPIPAFQEAYAGLGLEFEEDMSDEDVAAAEEALVACGCAPSAIELDGLAKRAMTLEFKDLSDEAFHLLTNMTREEVFAPGTKDGPGWITHPIPTSRIRNYWVKGEGAAKIGWGAGGDFNRCRSQLSKYVQNPDWLAGLCANMHKEALGIWPGEHKGAHSLSASGGLEGTPADIITLVASADTPRVYPSEWFGNPRFKQPMGMRIDKATRRIYGHLAHWGVCHIGIGGVCVEAPKSQSRYANFLKGVVDTEAGEQAVGCLTYGIGHANPALRAAAATAHYDRTDAVRAFVNIGEDQYGIWYSGILRPDVTDEQIDEMRAIGALSGDWRRIGRYGLDLVAAVAVNTPGYPVTSLAASGEMRDTVIFSASEGVQDTVIISNTMGAEVITASAEDIEANKAFMASLVAAAVQEIELKRRAETIRARAFAMRQTEVRARITRKA